MASQVKYNCITAADVSASVQFIDKVGIKPQEVDVPSQEHMAVHVSSKV